MFYLEVTIMSNELLLKSFIEFLAILLCGLAVYKEKEIIRFQIKFCRFVKCFFRALAIAVRKERAAKSNVVELNAETERSAEVKREKSGIVRIA